MRQFNSILWVGHPDPLGSDRVADAPDLEIAWARDADEALALPLAAFDALVIDSAEPAATIEALPKLRAEAHHARIVVLVPEHAARTRSRLKQSGADVVLVRNHANDTPDLTHTLAALPRPLPERIRTPSQSVPTIVAQSRAMQHTMALVERARPSRATVLLTGETGTGKEVLARTIHSGSPRRDRPFVAINCAAFPDTLLESELFGHVRGAFTGAEKDKKGLFEQADGGVLFLDEVGETSPTLQAKMLRVLQEREVRALGGSRSRHVDVRLVAATNRDLLAEVERHTFREDLYYRLAVFPVRVPPLRERRDDILALAGHFLALHGARDAKPGCHLRSGAAELLLAHTWPGNVRELENEMQRCVALAEPGQSISPELLSERISGTLPPSHERGQTGETLREALERVEAWLIRRTLTANAGRRTITARELGVTREGLYKKMKRLGIE
jgi:transcriptional regulator with PAS, ATPase and Fis domain